MPTRYSDVTSNSVEIEAGNAMLAGDLMIAPDAVGLVIFAHGSGSSRISPRNTQTSDVLNEHGLSTLLFDLLTADECVEDELTRHYRFNIPLLSSRLIAAIDWVARDKALAAYPLGCFGASTGAAAALVGAARRSHLVKAVVSRGGRPDLAVESLSLVSAPTLLIVGGSDDEVLQLNRRAASLMHGTVQLHIVPGATHLFPEPGAMEHVGDITAKWFRRYLRVSETTE